MKKFLYNFFNKNTTRMFLTLFLGFLFFIPSAANATVPTWDEALSGPCCNSGTGWFKQNFNDAFEVGRLGREIDNGLGVIDWEGGWFYNAWMSTFGPYGWFTQKEVGTAGYQYLQQQSLKEPFDALAFYSAKQALNDMTIQATNFLKSGRYSLTPSGSKVDEPLFVENHEDYYWEKANNTIGNVLFEYAETPVCDAFKADTQRTLELTRNDYIQQVRPLKERASCDFTDADLQAFYNDFSSGGFDALIAQTENANNPFGAVTMGFSDVALRAGSTQRELAQRVVAGQGYLDLEACPKNEGVRVLPDGSGQACIYDPVNDFDCYCARFVSRTSAQMIKGLTDPSIKSEQETESLTDEVLEETLSITYPAAGVLPVAGSVFYFQEIDEEIRTGAFYTGP